MSELLSFIRHPRRRNIFYREATRHFSFKPKTCMNASAKMGTKVFEGMHSALKRTFKPGKGMKKYQNGDANRMKPNEFCHGTCDLSHGSIVDQDMSLYVNLLTRNKQSPSVFLKNEPTALLLLNKESMRVHHRTYDPCSWRLVRLLASQFLRPVVTQYPVYDCNIRVASSVDLVCENERTQKVVLVEVKTTRHTCSEYYEKEQSDCKKENGGCLSGLLKWSFRNTDLLQILMCGEIVRRNYNCKPQLLLMRIGPSDEACWQYSPDIAKEHYSAIARTVYSQLRADELQRRVKRKRRGAKKKNVESV